MASVQIHHWKSKETISWTSTLEEAIPCKIAKKEIVLKAEVERN